MNTPERRRPLEDLLDELVAGLQALPRLQGSSVGVTGVQFSLPVEMRVRPGTHGLVVHADMPALRTRTDFDLPVGRLGLNLAVWAPEGEP